MSKSYYTYFYLALFFSLLGFIFPIYITWAIGFDIGDIYEWVWGLQIIIPRNLKESLIGVYWVPSYSKFILSSSAIVFVVLILVEIKNLKHGKIYHKKNVMYASIFLLILVLFYQFGTGWGIPLSINFFFLSVILAFLGNSKVKKEIRYT
jgi:hypothetical protein